MENVIKKFLSVSDGDGYGSGYGDGYGDGYGYGSGYGFGDGDGYGDGSGILSINGKQVHLIDGVRTIIESVHGQYAKGYILQPDLTLKPCYIAKCGNYFAHGETLKQAQKDARNKFAKNMPVDERIRLFNEQYPDREKKIPAIELFDWHNTLTGSCLMGRQQFCNEHGIDLGKKYTVNYFIELTKNAYGGDIIRQLEMAHPKE